MKSHHLSIYVRITLIAVITGVMTACATDPHYHDPAPYYLPRVVYYDYWYYPAIGAYYDPREHIYIYYEHNQWIRARALPHRIRPYLGHHVTVHSPNDRPYEVHHRHRGQHQPERYRERDPAHVYDTWIGAPYHQSPQHVPDDRRRESHDRDRNGNDQRHEPERGTVPVPPRNREPDMKYQRQAPDPRPKDAPRHREPPASTAPIKRDDKWRQPQIRKEKSREQYRSGDVRRNSERMKDHDRSGSSTRRPGQIRAPDSREQLPKKPPQTAPGHREPPTKTVPIKRDDKRHQRENRKEDTQHRHREGDDRHGDIKEDDTSTQKRQRNQVEKYEQYR